MPEEPEQELRETESEHGEEKHRDRTTNGYCSNDEHNPIIELPRELAA